MKFIKTFESFVNDDNRGEESYYPKYNQGNSIKAKEYVDELLKVDSDSVFKKFNVEKPKDGDQGEEFEKAFDKVREIAIKYYNEHPNEIENTEVDYKPYAYDGGDGIARVQNVGGALRESYKPVPNAENTYKVDITDDQIELFLEYPLRDLVKQNKVTIQGNEVWYCSDDKETEKVLDEVFDI